LALFVTFTVSVCYLSGLVIASGDVMITSVIDQGDQVDFCSN